MLEETLTLYTFDPKMYARYRTDLYPQADRQANLDRPIINVQLSPKFHGTR